MGRMVFVNPPVSFFGDCWHNGMVHRDGPLLGQVDFDLLILNDAGVEEIVDIPEVPGSERVDGRPADVVFEGVTYAERFYRDVLLTLIGIHGSGTADLRVHVLDVRGGSGDNRAVFFSNADVDYFERFKTALVGEDEQAEIVQCGIGLNADSPEQLPSSGTIGFETDFGLQRFKNERLKWCRVGRLRARGCRRRRSLHWRVRFHFRL